MIQRVLAVVPGEKRLNVDRRTAAILSAGGQVIEHVLPVIDLVFGECCEYRKEHGRKVPTPDCSVAVVVFSAYNGIAQSSFGCVVV